MGQTKIFFKENLLGRSGCVLRPQFQIALHVSNSSQMYDAFTELRRGVIKGKSSPSVVK